LASDLLNISQETKKIRINFGEGDYVFLNKNISFSQSLENLLILIAPAFVKFFFLIFLIYFFKKIDLINTFYRNKIGPENTVSNEMKIKINEDFTNMGRMHEFLKVLFFLKN
jgi:hypothetical protein